MEHTAKVQISFPNCCAICSNAGIGRCGRCLSIYYCCEEHQHQHWPLHIKTCKKSAASNQVPVNTIQPSAGKRTLNSNLNETEKRSPGNLNVTEKRNFIVTEDLNVQSNFEGACMKVIEGLNSRGICVLDNFMGTEYGNGMLLEVEDLYKKRRLEKGRLIATNSNVARESVRSDAMTWVTGKEPGCINIRGLIRKIDEMVDTINKNTLKGALLEYKLLSRTRRIMVACYPGCGTHYQTHVDTSLIDGQRITFVFYFNHKWNMNQNCYLRAYPASSSQYLDIEPLFDRLVIFWSDRRIPHEVLPAHANRFAITMWYFDYDEREAFKKLLCETTKNS